MPFGGPPGPGSSWPGGTPLAAPVAPAAAGPAAPPPPAGSRMPWPPPPVPDQPTLALPAPVPSAPPAPAQPDAGPPDGGPRPLSDTLERMLRPQGLFQNPQARAFDWQQTYSAPPAPSTYAPPPSGPYPASGPYPPGASGPYPPAPEYPARTSSQPPPPPAAWTQATSALPPGPPRPVSPEPETQAGGRFPYGGALPGTPGNGQNPNGPYQTGQNPNGQYQNGQPGPGDPGQFGPTRQYSPDGPYQNDAPGPGTPGGRTRKLPKGPLVPLAAAGGVAVIVVAALLLSSQNGPSSNTANPGAGTSTPTTGASATGSGSAATAQVQRQAATQLSGLAKQSGADHADVNAAVTSVQNCGKNLGKDVRVFRQSAANRRALLRQLGQLAGRQTLPAGMVADLTEAWQSSATVDTDLAKWAADQVGHCKRGNTKDHNYQVTYPYDTKSTNAKEAFVRLWNPLAHKDGLPVYQWSQL